MIFLLNHIEKSLWHRWCRIIPLIAVWVVLTISGTSLAKVIQQQSFESPDAAGKSFFEAIKSKDSKALGLMFGPGSDDVISSGDPVADNARYERFTQLYEEKNRFQEVSPEKVVIVVGNDEWPFPIPIVKKGSLWYFDTAAGRHEILARRIGENELNTIQVCLAYVDAQREYAIEDWDGDGIPKYAQKIVSDPGKKNGLYWKTSEGEKESPFGPLAAEAVKQGYTRSAGKPVPYHGYYFRILKSQGKHAKGGAYDYVVRGKMIGGFALVAYPAKYGASGIMTFIVNHDGVVYQKNLGSQTGKIALAMKQFDPDATWQRVDQKDLTANVP